MAEPTNQQKLDNVNARANWLFEKMPEHLRNLILSYRGVDGKAPKDLYGKITDAPQDTANALLNTKIRSAFDGKEYTFRDYLVTDNQRLNEARIKDAARDAQITALIDTVQSLAKGQNLDVGTLLAQITTASEAGVKAAIDSIETTVTIKQEK